MSERLPESPTQVLDRSRRVTIYYRRQAVQAFEGDTIASALLASGVKVFSRSFKYHRPRAPFCLSGQCARCTMTVDGRPHVRTCQTLVREGQTVEPQGDPDRDLKGLADSVSWAMPAGFYYKSMYKPKWVWTRAMKSLRTAPGNLGEITPLERQPGFDEMNLTPELLVVGGGLAGMEAALVGAEAGLRVVLVEAEPALGGFEAFQGQAGLARVRELIGRLRDYDNLKVLTRTTASALYPDRLVVCIEAVDDGELLERSWQIRPRATVIASGALSRPLLFTHNDRPGVILPEAAQRLIHLWGVRPGRRAFLAGGEDYLARVALDLAASGVEVAGLADFRPDGPGPEMAQALAEAGISLLPAATLVAARGRRAVEGAEVVGLDGSGGRAIKSEVIVASAGLYPRHKLLGQAGARLVHWPELNLHLPEALPSGYQAAGRVLGLEDPEAIRAQGRLAGARALAGLGLEAAAIAAEAEARLEGAPALRAAARPVHRTRDKSKTFVCFCNDATEKDVEAALVEGFDNIETCKRYTTTTMGLCQGGMCQANFADLLAQKRPELKARVLTTPRNPAAPLSFGVMAVGHHDQPRLTPLHQLQMEQGGVPLRSGSWVRIEHFGHPEAESLAVRQAAGMCDVSTLGKFRVFGPDAEKLLDRVNTKSLKGLKGNKILYTAACNEEGVMIDDGVIIKLGPDDYFFTASTGRGAVTPEWYARWRREEDWQVWLVDLTESRAGMNLAGPRSREILARLTGADVSNQALPYMHWLEAGVAGVKALILRMGFLGELSYEIHVPASQGNWVWSKLLEAGAEAGLRPVGLETQFTLRLEKGHALPGLDIDGNTTLLEAGFGWLWDRSKEDLVGGPMLRLLEGQPFQQTVVGFSLEGRQAVKEGFLVIDGPERLGYVTSVRYSQTLNKTIGLALVKPHPDFRPGGRLILWGEGRQVEADYTKPPFYDPEGERLRI